MDRRSVLVWLGSVGITSLTGCIARGNDQRSPPDSAVPEITGTDIFTTRAQCQSTDGPEATVEFKPNQVVIDGVGSAPTPCHRAVITTTRITDGILTVQIGFDRVDEVCIDCVGAIAYRATITIDSRDQLQAVHVTHATSEFSETVTAPA